MSVTYSLHILYAIVIFKHPLITTTNGEIRKWVNQCKADYNFCPKCFHYADDDDATIARLPFKADCEQIENNVAITNNDIIKAFNNLFGTKQISYGNYGNMDGNNKVIGGTTRVVIKYLFDQAKLDGVARDVCEHLLEDGLRCADTSPFRMSVREVVGALQRRFLDKERMEGCVICPLGTGSAERFADLVSSRVQIGEVFKWLALNLNVQPLLLSVSFSDIWNRTDCLILLKSKNVYVMFFSLIFRDILFAPLLLCEKCVEIRKRCETFGVRKSGTFVV
jgi:hypothetical protein